MSLLFSKATSPSPINQILHTPIDQILHTPIDQLLHRTSPINQQELLPSISYFTELVQSTSKNFSHQPAASQNFSQYSPAASGTELALGSPGRDNDGVPTYSYYVKLINPKKKSDFVVRIPYSRDYKYPSIIRTPQIQVPI